MAKQLPTKSDFLEYHGCLDAQEAWKNFGGLTVDAAYSKFREKPYHYQEDFMFMGEMAFAYYFEVLDRYVRDAVREQDQDAYECFDAVRSVIEFHFMPSCDEEPQTKSIRDREGADGVRLREEVIKLCDFLLLRLPDLVLRTPRHSSVSAEYLFETWYALQQRVGRHA